MQDNHKYHFVKFTEDGIWYLKPECLDDVTEHFEKIFGREIKAGVKDFISSRHVHQNWCGTGKDYVYDAHPTTPWNMAVSTYCDIHGTPWVMEACKLENEVYQNRIGYFLKGLPCYLPEGVACYCHKLEEGEDYYDEVWKDELEYPTKKQYTLDDVKFMQWNMFGNKGKHWYATIEKRDVLDKDGNMKWNTRAEAEKAAKWFIANKMNK
mgnify:CR=1 FL=1